MLLAYVITLCLKLTESPKSFFHGFSLPSSFCGLGWQAFCCGGPRALAFSLFCSGDQKVLERLKAARVI